MAVAAYRNKKTITFSGSQVSVLSEKCKGLSNSNSRKRYDVVVIMLLNALHVLFVFVRSSSKRRYDKILAITSVGNVNRSAGIQKCITRRTKIFILIMFLPIDFGIKMFCFKVIYYLEYSCTRKIHTCIMCINFLIKER
jgi:hypothetical protein